MKYSKEIYQKALKALDALRKTLPEEQRPTLDFVAEAIREKAERDLMPAAEAITELSGKVEQLKSENQKLRKLAENGKSAIDTSQRLSQKLRELVSKTEELEKQLFKVTAAVKKLPHVCETCVYHNIVFNGCTLDHDCTNPDGGCSNNYDRWIWNRKGE